ncbi:MAG: glycosyltransferase family 2 protein [Planctomycetaceae bacterium]|nr:glycosyltransferase family 2 protein [Planctomycetaceae bacterium]
MSFSVSVVVPIYNEEENVPLMYDALNRVLPETQRDYEIIFVDDGSTDRSLLELERIAAEDRTVKIVEFRGNFGQSAAMGAGIQYASKDVVITMDGDLQNDPTDIPMMMAKIEEGYDLVHGWRKNRQDAFINRKLPSQCANWLISKVTGFPVRDLGCTLKAVRSEVAREIELYGEMHRFIPILAAWRGAKCVEVVTNHHPRQFGVSKYGIGRVFRVVLDLITVKFLIQYMISPMRLFGTAGISCLGISGLSGLATIGMKLIGGVDMTGNPLFTLAVFSGMVSLQFFVLGMLGEMGSRIYFSNDRRPPFAVRDTVNFESEDSAKYSPSFKRAA